MVIESLYKNSISEILALYNGNFSDGWTESMLDSGFDGGRLFAFGAYMDKKLVGVITISLSLDDADIEGVVVDKEFRCKGIAKALIERAHDFILSKGIKKVLLEVRQSNAPAISLYKSVGYTQISTRKGYYQDGENALILIKEF